jgi:hypothetical protein
MPELCYNLNYMLALMFLFLSLDRHSFVLQNDVLNIGPPSQFADY